MKNVLLDENLPKPLARLITGEEVEVTSVHDLGWAEKKNGELIRAMLEQGFEYLLTSDKNLQHQQNLEKYPIKLILIRSFDNRLKTLAPFAEIICQRIQLASASEKVIEIDLRIAD